MSCAHTLPFINYYDGPILDMWTKFQAAPSFRYDTTMKWNGNSEEAGEIHSSDARSVHRTILVQTPFKSR